MSDKPNFIDNIDGNTLTRALRKLIKQNQESINSLSENDFHEVRIATAYFSPSGFSNISKVLSDISSVKLLLGSDPIADNARWQRKLDESEDTFYQKN